MTKNDSMHLQTLESETFIKKSTHKSYLLINQPLRVIQKNNTKAVLLHLENEYQTDIHNKNIIYRYSVHNGQRFCFTCLTI